MSADLIIQITEIHLLWLFFAGINLGAAFVYMLHQKPIAAALNLAGAIWLGMVAMNLWQS